MWVWDNFRGMNLNYLEYDPFATSDSVPTLCQEIIVEGCTNPVFRLWTFNVDNGTCQSLEYVGCTDSTYQEYDPLFTVNNQDFCLTPHIYGCTNYFSRRFVQPISFYWWWCLCFNRMFKFDYVEYYTQGFILNSDDPTILESFDALFCNELAVFGCTSQFAINFNQANISFDEWIWNTRWFRLFWF